MTVITVVSDELLRMAPSLRLNSILLCLWLCEHTLHVFQCTCPCEPGSLLLAALEAEVWLQYSRPAWMPTWVEVQFGQLCRDSSQRKGEDWGYGTVEHWLQVYCQHWNTDLIFAEIICYLLDTEQLDRMLAVSPFRITWLVSADGHFAFSASVCESVVHICLCWLFLLCCC